MTEYSSVDLLPGPGLISFVDAEKKERLNLALAFIESIETDKGMCRIGGISGREYWVGAEFYDDIALWWNDYLAGTLEAEDSTGDTTLTWGDDASNKEA